AGLVAPTARGAGRRAPVKSAPAQPAQPAQPAPGMAPPAGGAGPVSTAAIERWFAARGWQPFEFQRRAWAAIADGEDGLLHATTGAGKTYALWFGALQLETARASR